MVKGAPPTVAIMNDYDLVVEGLGRLLAPYSHRVRVVEVLVDQRPEQAVDVLLYDTFGHTRDLRAVLDLAIAKDVVVYTWAGSRAEIDAVLRAGASGFVAKSLSGVELVDAVERVHAGEQVLATESPLVADDSDEDWPGRREGLSAREAEVLAWIASGHSNLEVAERAFLSINTVKTYVRSAYRKMKVTSRSQAVIWAFEHGFGPTRRPPF